MGQLPSVVSFPGTPMRNFLPWLSKHSVSCLSSANGRPARDDRPATIHRQPPLAPHRSGPLMALGATWSRASSAHRPKVSSRPRTPRASVPARRSAARPPSTAGTPCPPPLPAPPARSPRRPCAPWRPQTPPAPSCATPSGRRSGSPLDRSSCAAPPVHPRTPRGRRHGVRPPARRTAWLWQGGPQILPADAYRELAKEDLPAIPLRRGADLPQVGEAHPGARQHGEPLREGLLHAPGPAAILLGGRRQEHRGKVNIGASRDGIAPHDAPVEVGAVQPGPELVG